MPWVPMVVALTIAAISGISSMLKLCIVSAMLTVEQVGVVEMLI